MPETIKNEPSISQTELKELLEKNLALTEEIKDMTKRINSYVTFQKIMSFVYFIIIVVPLILSIIYLPPLLKNFLEQYQQFLGSGTGNEVKNLFNK